MDRRNIGVVHVVSAFARRRQVSSSGVCGNGRWYLRELEVLNGVARVQWLDRRRVKLGLCFLHRTRSNADPSGDFIAS